MLALAALMIGGTSVQAAPVTITYDPAGYDPYNTANDGSTGTTTWIQGQSFTATKTGVLTSIGVPNDGDGSGTCTLVVYEGMAEAYDASSSNLIHTQVLSAPLPDVYPNGDHLTGRSGFATITLDAIVPITSGTLYSFYLMPRTCSDIAYFDYENAFSNMSGQLKTDLYTGGNAYYLADSGDNPFDWTTADMPFEVVQGDAVVANSAPTLSSVPTSAAVTEDVATTILDGGVSVADSDGDTVTLTLAVGAGSIASSDGNGTYSSVTVSNSGSASMTLAGTTSALSSYLSNGKIQYTTALNSNSAATLTITPNDGSENGTAASVTLNVTAVNDAASASLLNYDTVEFTEGGSPVLLDAGSNAVITDVDSADFSGGTLSVTGVSWAPSQDQLSIDTSGAVSLTGTTSGSSVAVSGTVIGTLVNTIGAGASLEISLNSNATPARVQVLLRALTYENISSSPINAMRTFTISLDDGDGASAVLGTVYVMLTAFDRDATVSAASGVIEPVALPTTAITAGQAVDLFDFTLTDGATADTAALQISQIKLSVSGTANEAELASIHWYLNGPDVSNASGGYSAGILGFSGLSVSVASGSSETYTISAYFNDNSGITDGHTVVLGLDGDSQITTGSGTGFGTTTPLTNGTGTPLSVTASQLVVVTQPAGSVSGTALTTQPVIAAQDAAGNLDLDFSETISLTEASTGSLTGSSVAAVNGLATFTSLTYTATADQQSFTLTADDQSAVGSDLTAVTTSTLTSDVVATALQFSSQPVPLSVSNGNATALTTVPVVQAVDAAGLLDSDYSTAVTLAEVNGAGSVQMSASGDTDGNAATVTLTPASGVATFTGLTVTYTVAGSTDETFNLQATSGSLPAVTSSQMTSSYDGTAPTIVSSIPADNATGVAYNTNLTITFSEPVVAGIGGLTIYEAETGRARYFDISDLTLNGSSLVTNSRLRLDPMVEYYVLTAPGLVTDVNGNSWPGLSDPEVLSFTVGNIAPYAYNDGASTLEDAAVAINVLVNDLDEDGALNPASVVVASAPENGSTSVNTANGVITYTPDANFNGRDSFTYQVEDLNQGRSAEATVTVFVDSVNDAPVAVADTIIIDEDDSVTVDVLANDTDVDGGPEPSSLEIVQAPVAGTATVVDGRIEYVAGADFEGTDSLTYQFQDYLGAYSNIATLTITVTGVNDVPVAAADNASTDEDTAVVIDVLDNDSDVDGSLDIGSVAVVQQPGNGAVSVDAATGDITYTPALNFFGSDSFTYVVADDASATSAQGTVTIVVASVNDAPVTVADTVILQEDVAHSIGVLGNDSDVDGTLVLTSIEVLQMPQHGTTSVGTDGLVLYQPDSNFAGSDSFSYRVQDDSGVWSNESVVSIGVTAVNDVPIANADTAETQEEEAVAIDVAANDSDVDGSLDLTSIEISQAPLNGELVDHLDGTLTYTPDDDFYGNDSFRYRISDDEAGASAAALVSINVVGINDAPVISGTPTASVLEGQAYSFTPQVTDSDSSNFRFELSGQPAWMSINSTTGVVSGTPSVGDAGTYSGIVITVDDGSTSNNLASLAAFSLTVEGDFDTDGIANSTDHDDDNDGISDSDELRYGLNPLDDTDALLDSDGDNISNQQEVTDGTDPTDGDDYYDVTPPVITAPAAITLDASAVFTRVTLAQLLGVTDDSAAINAALLAMTSDNVDGDACCTATVDGFESQSAMLRPGLHNLVFRALDAKGNEGRATQVVRIRPLVSFSKDERQVEGSTVTVSIELDGPAPDYPFEVPYQISSASSANDEDHTLEAGSVIFTAGSVSEDIRFELLDDGVAEGTETLIIALDDATSDDEDLQAGYDPNAIDVNDINAGRKSSVSISIVEGNIEPEVNLQVSQASSLSTTIARDGGNVTFLATATDGNVADTVTLSWADTDTRVLSLNTSSSAENLIFDPANLSPGRYRVEVSVTDSQGLVDDASLYFRVIDTALVLSAETDTNGNGIADADEGAGDADSDGIPDYLDSLAERNLLPEIATASSSHVVECDPGVHCRLGGLAMEGSSGGALLYEAEFEALEGIGSDSSHRPVGGIFDFIAAELPVAGSSVQVVLPLHAAIEADAVYRKYQNGVWMDFVEDDNNSVHSAAGAMGFCPPPGDASWVAGLTEGHLCVQLTIEDGGPNDADGEANGAVEDPGAVSVLSTAGSESLEGVTTRSTRSGGAVSGWWLLLLGAALWLSRQPSGKPLPQRLLTAGPGIVGLGVSAGALVLSAVLTPKAAVADSFDTTDDHAPYILVRALQVAGSNSSSDFEQQLQQQGQTITVDDYDTSRFGYQLGLGYEYAPHLALEFSYLDMGDAEVTFSGTANPTELRAALKDEHPVGGAGWLLDQVFVVSPLERLNLEMSMGLYRWSSKTSSSHSAFRRDPDSGVDVMLGLGAEYQALDDTTLELRWQQLRIGSERLQMLGIGSRILLW
ncbi:tandem-95 repeat protein [Oceanobacter kriegii]|uniref:tandem-95 repeat protein n=1 Tax=Oceanobacter kriegii TaxID=64972 RepID=UPI00146AAF7D|nr:tandem-95 repeat protein [Oceanobacter kriegii]